MDSTSFVYWLNGYFELSGATELNEKQVKIVKEHIALVLKKETVQYNGITIAPNNPNIKLYPTNNYSTVTQDTLVNVPTNLTC